MIENLKYDEKTVSWNTKSGKRVEKTHNSISNVLTNSKEVYFLYSPMTGHCLKIPSRMD